jgi:hypothetical protein
MACGKPWVVLRRVAWRAPPVSDLVTWKARAAGVEYAFVTSAFLLPLRALPVAAVAAILSAGCGGGGGATLRTFAGTWQGHSRGLTITRDGRAKESIYSGCCDRVIEIEFRLSRPRGTSQAATAIATVTAVRIRDTSYYGNAHPAPHVGESRTLRLREGVMTESLTGTTYCDGKAGHVWKCGV